MVSPEGNKEAENKNWRRAQDLRELKPRLIELLNNNENLAVRAYIETAMNAVHEAAEILAPTPKPPKPEKVHRGTFTRIRGT